VSFLDAIRAKDGKPPRTRGPSRIFYSGGVEETTEFARIFQLPRYRWQDDDELEELARGLDEMFGKPERIDCDERCVCRGERKMSMRPIQAAALQGIHDIGGLLGPIRVGGGKTLISYLAGSVTEAERVLLLIPAKLRDKTEREFRLLARHWQGPKRLHIISYELLSRDRGVEELNAYQPDLIIADEAHKLKNTKAACTKRVRRYLKEHPDTVYVDMSGTTTKRSIMEYYHRQAWALPKESRPLPREWNECKDWADAIDEKPSAAGRLMPGALLHLLSPEEEAELAKDSSKQHALRLTRQAYRRRLVETPGVVATEEMHDADMSLIIQTHHFTPNDRVLDAFHGLREDWELPDGHCIDQASTLWRHCRELVQGFFYKWDPPPPPEWLMARRDWSRCVREALNRFRDLDSPLMVQRALEDGRLDWAKPYYNAWLEIRDTFEPNTVPEWLDDTCLNWAAKWANQNTGIIWCHEVAFAERLSQVTGLPYYGRQGKCGKRMIEDETQTCIASIMANSEGRNLQQFNKNLIVSVPPGGAVWEQMLGRTHRDGQQADEIQVDVLLCCYEQWDGFRQARSDAEYIERTTGQAQKLVFADINTVDEATVERWHNEGDVLWNKANARFFKHAERGYTEQEQRMASLSMAERAEVRRGQAW
jgi:hypothetical protein